jgi:DNA-directed RNA polymerase subunit omega
MLKPSYAELMDVMNKEKDAEVTSRYTVVIAAAKRARQLIDGDEPMIDNPVDGKPVSTAVAEIYAGKIAVVPEGEGTKIKIKKKKEKLELEEEIQQAKPNNEKEAEEASETLEVEEIVAPEDVSDFTELDFSSEEAATESEANDNTDFDGEVSEEE